MVKRFDLFSLNRVTLKFISLLNLEEEGSRILLASQFIWPARSTAAESSYLHGYIFISLILTKNAWLKKSCIVSYIGKSRRIIF